ncbi:MAG TPA: DinB family protein [Candidatus Dormibacteraeota bacterium]|nr:DinB family protein [Candidatus Dormibacteraeota bacterium]
MTTLAAIFEHNRWANEQLLVACRGLTTEQYATTVDGTYGELGETLAHIASGELFYTLLLTGWVPDTAWQQDDPFPGVEPLLEIVRETGPRLHAAAASIRGEQPIERDPGELIPASVILVQAINHATEHRAHATTILTQLGIRPPAIDGWHFGGFE